MNGLRLALACSVGLLIGCNTALVTAPSGPDASGSGSAFPATAGFGPAGTAGLGAGGLGGAGAPAANGGAGRRAGAGGAGAAAGDSAADSGNLGSVNSAPQYIDLAPPMGAPLDGIGTPLDPPAPDGWTWYAIDGAVCRDGSPTGFYVHNGSDSRLLMYLEGGGACTNAYFCAFNSANINTVLAGDGRTVIGTALGALPARQQPGVYTQFTHDGAPTGMFDFANPDNPFKDWSQIYIPYCTGDVFFGTKQNGSLPGLSNQQFVGYLNMKLFMSRIVPTFSAKVSRVVLSGASAGAFGALLNFSMVQDSFGDVPVDLLDDSGPLFSDKFMATCMQKHWRELWGFDASLPADCGDCRQADGGGLINLVTYVLRKHPNVHVAVISGMQDEMIRLVYSMGLQDCANYDTADPVQITVSQIFDPSVYMAPEPFGAGLTDLRARYQGTGRMSTFYIGGSAANQHQHIFRPEFYTDGFGALRRYVGNFVNGKVEQIGPDPEQR